MPQDPKPDATSRATAAELKRLRAQVRSLQQQVKELQQQVHTDPLTGLGNYRHFSQNLEQEMERSQRSGLPTTLIMLDLDFFKRLNDTHGHEAGNQALVATGKLLQACTRKLDIACRYGGEEFAIILPSTDLLTGVQVAERLRRRIEACPLQLDAESVHITASLGVDMFRQGDNCTPEAFVQRADALLYQAKQAGRNRVCSGERSDLHTSSSVSSDEKDALFDMFRPQDEGN